jgi:hypothetical protein
MDYLGIQQMLAGIDSDAAAQQLAQQNPNLDPHKLLPHFTPEAMAAGSDAGTLYPPAGQAGGTDWAKMLTGAKGLVSPLPTQPIPTAHPFALGATHLARPNVVLPGGPMNTNTSFGQLMGARKNAY